MAHTFNSQQDPGALEGNIPAPPRQAQRTLNVRANAPFYLTFHPHRWHLVGDEWLPQLGKLKVSTGVGAVDRSGDVTAAEVELRKRGWTVLPWDVCDGVYLREFPAKGGGRFYIERWATPKQVGGRVFWTIDTDAYHDWLRQLHEGGVIPTPDPDVLDALADIQRSRVERVQGVARRDTSQAAQQDLAAARSKLEAMDAATLEAAAGRQAKAPAKKATRKSTTTKGA